jgi:hypothetical protein
MTVAIEHLQELIGHTFPGGSTSVPPHRNWLASDAMGVAVSLADDHAHPMFAYFMGLGGLGVSLDELFALVGATAADGVMFGEAEIELLEPIHIGVEYAVGGRIVDIVRKSGASAGIFDLVTFETDIRDPSGTHVATARNSFVFPRGHQ